jgi:hypothetical protein
MRSLGWKKVLRSTPVAYIMTEDVASTPSHAGSTYAELDDLEQRIMDKFPAPRNYLIWSYIKINSDGTTQSCNLQPPKSESRFVAIDAKRRKYEETKELVDDEDETMIQGKGDVSEEDVSVVAAGQEPGSPEVTAVARITGNTPPKDTSEHVYEKPSNQSLISDAAGTQLFDATDGQNDSD